MKFNIGITGQNGSLGKIIKKNKSHNNYFYYTHDIRDKKKIYKWYKKNNLNVIFHLAAIVPIKSVNKNRKKAYDVNFVGTKNLDMNGEEMNREFHFDKKSVIIVGNEGKGIRRNILTKCDFKICIPQENVDGIDSYNVANSLAIAAYHFKISNF